jgi:hypothetical protein
MPLSRLLPVPPLNSSATFRRFAPISGVTTQLLYHYTIFAPPASNSGLIIPDWISTGVGATWTGNVYLDVYISSGVGAGVSLKFRGNQGVTTTGGGITAYNGQYFISWSGGITLAQDDVIVGNVTGATGKVYKSGASLTDTHLYDLSANLFSTADTNFTVNGVASGKTITGTAFGTSPATGLYLTPAPANLADKNAGAYSPFIFNKGRTMDSSSIAQFCFSGFTV